MHNIKPLAIFYDFTTRFVSDLVGNPEDRFSHNEAQMIHVIKVYKTHLTSWNSWKFDSKSTLYNSFIRKSHCTYLFTSVSFSLQAIAYNKLIFLLIAVVFLYASNTISHSPSPPSFTAVQYTVVRIFGSILKRYILRHMTALWPKMWFSVLLVLLF